MKNILTVLFFVFIFNLNGHSQSDDKVIKEIILGGFIDKLDGQDETALIDYNGGYLFTEVTIRHKKYKFLIDTGSTISIISDEVVLNSKEVGSIIVTDLQGNDNEKKVYQNDLLINNTTFKNIAFITQNLKSINLNTCWKIDGIIGSNILKKCNWKFDFKNNKIYFSNNAFIISDLNNVCQVKWYNDVSPLIRLKYKDKFIVVALDTGYSGMLKLSNNVFNDVFSDLKNTVEIGNGLGLQTINSIIKGEFKRTTLNDILVGTNKINNIHTLIDNSKPLLGNKFFGNDDLILNFIENSICIGNNIQNELLLSDLNVCRNVTDDTVLEICFVWDTKSTKDLKIGDQIIKMDNKDVSILNEEMYCDIQNYLKANKNINITVKRNGKLITTIIN